MLSLWQQDLAQDFALLLSGYEPDAPYVNALKNNIFFHHFSNMCKILCKVLQLTFVTVFHFLWYLSLTYIDAAQSRRFISESA